MPRPARITLWVSFLLAVAGFGSWLIGGPPLVMLASVGAAAIGLFVLIPYFIYRVPKPVIVVSVHLDQPVDDAVAVVRAALASIGWVETGDASVASPWASVGTSDTIAGDLVLMAMSAAAERGTVEARTAIAPRPPAGAAWSLL